MASVYTHPKSGIYHVAFWYVGKQHRKSLRTRNKRKAQEDTKAVQRAVDAIKSGRDKEGLRLIRHGIPILDVIFPTPKVKELLAGLDRKPLTLRQLLEKWLEHQEAERRSPRTIASN